MELILLENIINLGSIGDKIIVKNGYGRNFLLKYGKAIRFNKENEQLVIKQKAELNKKNIEIKNQFIKTAKLIEGAQIIFNKECKENGDLYATIKPKEIANFIKEKLKANVSPSQIVLKVELKKIGIYKATVNLHAEVQSTFSIKIDKIKSK